MINLRWFWFESSVKMRIGSAEIEISFDWRGSSHIVMLIDAWENE